MYQYDQNKRPDEDFEPGELAHLVPGNPGRLLDFRRTPVSITGVRPDVGLFNLEITAFEDAGAIWEMPLEKVSNYQFERGCERASAADVAAMEAAIERFDRRQVIEAGPGVAADTRAKLERAERSAREVIGGSPNAPDGLSLDTTAEVGSASAFALLREFLEGLGVWNIEAAIAPTYVSCPVSQTIEAHRIVIAELGLCPFEGRVLRDPSVYEGALSAERRAAHVVARMGFVRALFRAAGFEAVTLYRGVSAPGVIEPHPNRTFVSSSFSRQIAESLFDSDMGGQSALYRQPVALERLFMTYLETEPMNRQYKEREAILLWERSLVF